MKLTEEDAKNIERFMSERKYDQTDLDFLLTKAIEESVELTTALIKLQKLEFKKKYRKDFEDDLAKENSVMFSKLNDIIEEFAHVSLYVEHLVDNKSELKNFEVRVENERKEKLNFFRDMKITK